MSEIYQEKLSVLGPVYMARERALDAAIDEAVDSSRFSPEEMASNIKELGEIAESENIIAYYISLLFERIVKKEE